MSDRKWLTFENVVLINKIVCASVFAVLVAFAGYFLVKSAFGHDGMHDAWYANQVNMMGGSCCHIGDGHGLDPGDVRFDAATGLYSVRLPDPSETTFGKSLSEPSDKPKLWVEIEANKMRDPSGGMPPISTPIIWYDTYPGNLALDLRPAVPAFYKIYCFEPNAQF